MQKKKKTKRTLSGSSRTAFLLRKIWEKALQKGSVRGIGFVPGKQNNYQPELRRLEKFGLINTRKIENCGYQINITEDGICEALILEARQAFPLSRNGSKVCMIVFDIPEKHRDKRDFVRRLLNHCDFFPIQKSVWISLFDVSDQMFRLFKMLNLDEWVWVFVSDRIDEIALSCRSSLKCKNK